MHQKHKSGSVCVFGLWAQAIKWELLMFILPRHYGKAVESLG